MNQYKIIRGTGMEDDIEFDMYGDGVLSGGRRRVATRRKCRKGSEYNTYVKKYAKKYKLSIGEAAHDIKKRCLWNKEKCKPRRKLPKATSKRKPAKACHRRKKTVMRGKGYDDMNYEGYDDMNYGGASRDELINYMNQQAYEKKIERLNGPTFDDQFDKLLCTNLKKLYSNYVPTGNRLTDIANLTKLKESYSKCNKNIGKPQKPLTQTQKNFLLEKLLESYDSQFSTFKTDRFPVGEVISQKKNKPEVVEI